MKRVLIAATLGGLLIVGVPTLASSAQRGGSSNSDSKTENSASAGKSGGDKATATKGGDKAAADNKGGENKSGDSKAGDNKSGDNKSGDNKGGDHKGDRGDHDRGDRGRYGHGYRGRYGYGGGSYYGEPQDCYYGPSGAYNCEPYGGDYGYGGYRRDPYGYNYSGNYRNRNVRVSQMRFNPGEVYAAPGQEVLWTFQDGNTPHTVTADNNSFDSGKVTEGEFRLVFDQPGTYSYHCAVHPDMTGRIIVQG